MITLTLGDRTRIDLPISGDDGNLNAVNSIFIHDTEIVIYTDGDPIKVPIRRPLKWKAVDKDNTTYRRYEARDGDVLYRIDKNRDWGERRRIVHTWAAYVDGVLIGNDQMTFQDAKDLVERRRG